MDEAELIRTNLRGEMARRGSTQDDLAKTIGCSRLLVNQKLNGLKDFTISDLEHISSLFGMSLYQLMLKLLQPIDGIKQVKP